MTTDPLTPPPRVAVKRDLSLRRLRALCTRMEAGLASFDRVLESMAELLVDEEPAEVLWVVE